MKTAGKKFRHILKKLRFYIFMFALLVILGSIFHVILRDTLLQNYQDLGTSMAQRYSAEIESELSAYRVLVSFGAESIDARVGSGESSEEIEEWIVRYCERLYQVLGEDVVDPYVVYEGRIVAANPWEGDSDYDYASTEWYQKALEADGQVIFTDVYSDVISGRQVITIAAMCRESGAVIAFDIYPENLFFRQDESILPEGTSMYIGDASGKLLYAKTFLEHSDEELEDYLSKIREGIRNGELGRYDSYVVDLDGNQRSVYYDQMDNGWYVVITVPFSSILDQLNWFSIMFGLVMLVGVCTLFFVALRNLRLDYIVERTNDTIRVLGNSYYALYRVDYKADTYEMIKGSEYVRSRIPSSGPYPDLVRTAGEVIEEKAFREFCESFSAENIRNLVTKRIRNYGGDFKRKFGAEYRWVSVRVLFDESLAPNEVVLCFREIEEEKRQQFQERKLLEEALESARQSEKSKHAFFNNMSHDMRTPLNAILGLSALLRQHADDPEKVKDYVDKISYSSQQLLDLVNDILDMSRMEQGKVVLNNQAFDLQECIQACAESFRPQAETEKKEFQVIYDLADARVMGDSIRISQILNNLLSNAFKFTPEGGKVTVSVRQMSSANRTQYQIRVQDTGIGMSEEFLAHVFEPYARETRFTSRQITGTGLGMPIVKSLVTQMSGQIYVESRLGEGTAFTVTVPFMTVQENAEEKNKAEEKVLKPEFFSLSGKKILLAEDNLVNMEIATEILTMNGLEILQAWNGEEALDLFRASEPFEIDAILMDMQMPRMDGCEAARSIRALPRPDAGTVPILAVTANAFAEDIAATAAAGMDAHISKPIDFHVLCETLERLTKEKGR